MSEPTPAPQLCGLCQKAQDGRCQCANPLVLLDLDASCVSVPATQAQKLFFGGRHWMMPQFEMSMQRVRLLPGQRYCAACDGTSVDRITATDCKFCVGTGIARKALLLPDQRYCAGCNGTGAVVFGSGCEACHGTGAVREDEIPSRH